MLVAQISDLHLVEPGQLFAGALDTYGSARSAVEHMHGLDPRPDVVLVTGDLTEHAAPAEYAALRGLLDSMGLPYHVMPATTTGAGRCSTRSPTARGRRRTVTSSTPSKVTAPG